MDDDLRESEIDFLDDEEVSLLGVQDSIQTRNLLKLAESEMKAAGKAPPKSSSKTKKTTKKKSTAGQLIDRRKKETIDPHAWPEQLSPEQAAAVKAGTTAPVKTVRTPSKKEQEYLDKSFLNLPRFWMCLRCGKRTLAPVGEFVMSPSSGQYTYSGGYGHLCLDCAEDLFHEWEEKYSEQLAVVLVCHALNINYNEQVYQNCILSGSFTIREYISRIVKSTAKRIVNFETYLVDLVQRAGSLEEMAAAASRDEESKDTKSKWSAADHNNRTFCLQSIGYDPFNDPAYTDENRKFLFNALSGYLTDEVLEDSHKLQSVIFLVRTMLQQEQIDRALTAELRKVRPNYEAVEKFSKIKDTIVSNVSKIASDNGISARSAGRSGKSNMAITYIMREMAENGFDDIKVNMVDVKTSTAYKEIAADNAKALNEELAFTGDEYASMVAEQAQMIRDLNKKLERTEEDLRTMKLQVKEQKARENLRKRKAHGDD